MPVALTDNSVRFPTGFAPWYVYKATLVASPAAFEYGDLLFPSSGAFDKFTDLAALILNTGYVMALEPFVVGMTEVQVAVPGSVLPCIAGGVIQPEALVKVQSIAGAQSIIQAAELYCSSFHLIKCCKDITVAQAQLGHTDIRTTMRYADMLSDHQAKAANMLNYGVQEEKLGNVVRINL